MTGLATIAAGLLAAGVVFAGPAAADQAQDDQYFAALQQIYADRSLEKAPNVDNAHLTCDFLARGWAVDAIADKLRKAHQNASMQQLQQEVHLAQSIYCP